MSGDIDIDGHAFPVDLTHFAFPWDHDHVQPEELAKLSRFPSLQSASLTDTDLDDAGLAQLSKATGLRHLCLQGTRVTNAGLRMLEGLPRLQSLRLKDNPQLTAEGIGTVRFSSLEELQIHETGIRLGEGLAGLLSSLRDVILDRESASYGTLRRVSLRHPHCRFLVKGRGTMANGTFDGRIWSSDPVTDR